MSMSIRPKSRTAFLLLALACSGVAEAGGRFVAELVRVTDGDTIVVRDADQSVQTVRLAFIDAPERDQPWGAEATGVLQRLTAGRWLTVEWHTTDRYGRRVGVVYVSHPAAECLGLKTCPRDLDAGQTMIQAGVAWWYRSYAREQPAAARERYANLERIARERRKGLWRDYDPIPPWQWRRAKRGR